MAASCGRRTGNEALHAHPMHPCPTGHAPAGPVRTAQHTNHARQRTRPRTEALPAAAARLKAKSSSSGPSSPVPPPPPPPPPPSASIAHSMAEPLPHWASAARTSRRVKPSSAAVVVAAMGWGAVDGCCVRAGQQRGCRRMQAHCVRDVRGGRAQRPACAPKLPVRARSRAAAWGGAARTARSGTSRRSGVGWARRFSLGARVAQGCSGMRCGLWYCLKSVCDVRQGAAGGMGRNEVKTPDLPNPAQFTPAVPKHGACSLNHHTSGTLGPPQGPFTPASPPTRAPHPPHRPS
jgi:hypothetical protein